MQIVPGPGDLHQAVDEVVGAPEYSNLVIGRRSGDGSVPFHIREDEDRDNEDVHPESPLQGVVDAHGGQEGLVQRAWGLLPPYPVCKDHSPRLLRL